MISLILKKMELLKRIVVVLYLGRQEKNLQVYLQCLPLDLQE